MRGKIPIVRLSVCLSADRPEERSAFCAWLSQNKTHVSRISENTGCGCCVLLYDLEVADEAAPIANAISATTSWTLSGAFDGVNSTVDEVLTELRQ